LFPADKEFTNSLGMKLVRIEPGSFMMGNDGPLAEEVSTGRRHMARGDFDERPVHKVTISRPFHMAAFEVTNAQYEQFDPAHRELRGKMGFSNSDDEAAVFVSWQEAAAFCEWLARREDLPYRLPTEAEWEYACRAGTTGAFHTGEVWPAEHRNNPGASWYPDRRRDPFSKVVQLHVGRTPPNPWGLYDMHGNVEEWCLDWYGPYEPSEQTDPAGRIEGDFKITRGGSHSSEIYHLRSANRAAALPEDRSWVIGFRVAIGEIPRAPRLPRVGPRTWQVDVKQDRPADLAQGPEAEEPFFKGPRAYVKIPDSANGPLFPWHNHDPAICQCPNGDLLAIWYSCVQEHTRELAVAASRLRYGQEEWDPADFFWGAPDRNNHAPALLCDGETIYHFNGISAAATWGNLALLMRTSRDNGVTWSKARLINPEHGVGNQPTESAFQTKEGWIVLPCDIHDYTTLYVSPDGGRTWQMPGGWIRGIHAGVVQLRDGRLLALGRHNEIDGRMPMSISQDMGHTWKYSASEFPPISGGQRLVLKRLREGPIFLAAFAPAMTITDASGRKRDVSGLYAALSFDDGQTWPVRRLISDDGPGRTLNTTDQRRFVMSFSTAEPAGYLACCQAANGVIHLISSRLHYQFNLAWLKTPHPATPANA
jgi:formylglycine-generating enzyme required for sulfatase activity